MADKTMSKSGRIIARRKMRSLSGRKTIEVFIWAPEEHESLWRCPFQIKGLYRSATFYGRGFDSVQALYGALETIRLKLRDSGHEFAVPNTEPPFLGFPMSIPEVLGPEVYRRLQGLVEREFAKAAKKFERAEKSAWKRRHGIQ